MVLLVKLGGVTNRTTNGFTFIELLVVVAIIGIMASVGYVSVSKLQATADTNTSLDKLVASIKNQRIYAMLGNSTTRVKAMPQGIYFEQGSSTYIIFSCEELQDCSYIPFKSSNEVESLEKSLIFSNVSLPGNQIVFAPYSGEIVDYQANLSTLTIDNIYDHSTTAFHITQFGTLEITP